MAEGVPKGSFRYGTTLIEWDMPDYSQDELDDCERGKHKSSRRRVINGWIGFSQIEHYYCACGVYRWLRFNGQPKGGGDPTIGSPGSHREWIASMAKMAEYTESMNPWRSKTARWLSEHGMTDLAKQIEKFEAEA